ncbi:hypothetical protein GCM10009037_26620 [Halarchaeum grantii]|uniref:MalT-like winged helix domain-containing protein n=1 Tax=Halarchaeum grantii TaxID=1193105 RepID=A0A830FD36_9EURY|nr:hypothetical protein [Halarchaeum grantii]GGL41693.1 hypothetical protein GCM10009037_26620 [Halarchaeum grantii]
MRSNVRSDELDTVHEAIHAGEQTVHLYGEPGVGVNQFLDDVLEDLEDRSRVRGVTVRRGHTPDVIAQDLLAGARDAAGVIQSFKNQVTGVDLGIWNFSVGVQLDDRSRHLKKLQLLTENLSIGDPLVLYLKDVHKIAPDSPEQTRDFLRELSEALGPAARLVTTGRIPYDGAACSIELEMYDLEESGIILRDAFEGISESRIEEIHSAVDGHPYYLDLLIETSDTEPELQIRDDVYDYIEKQYLKSLSEREETFLRYTSPLIELDAELCTNILDDFSRSEVRQTLESLREKIIIRELGRSDESGLLVYDVHPLFREFLYERTDETDTTHRAAFQYYAHEAFAEQDTSQLAPLQGFAYSTFAGIHLENLLGENPSPTELASEIEQLGFGPGERLNFVMGFAPYSPLDHHSRLLVPEIDRFYETFAEQEVEEGEEADYRVGLLLINLLRGQVRSRGPVEFEKTAYDIYESVLEEIQEDKFTDYLDEPDGAAVQDGLEMLCRVMIYREATTEEEKREQQKEILDVLETYGLDREVALGFFAECRTFLDTLESNVDVETALESRVGSMIDDAGEDGMVRTSLVQMQDDLFMEVLGGIGEFASRMADDSEWVIQFIEAAGEELGRAENPVFAAMWYSISGQLLGLFTEDAAVLSPLQDRFETYRDARAEYEQVLDSPLIEADELGDEELEMPEFMDDIATTDSQTEFLDTGGESDNARPLEDGELDGQ